MDCVTLVFENPGLSFAAISESSDEPPLEFPGLAPRSTPFKNCSRQKSSVLVCLGAINQYNRIQRVNLFCMDNEQPLFLYQITASCVAQLIGITSKIPGFPGPSHCWLLQLHLKPGRVLTLEVVFAVCYGGKVYRSHDAGDSEDVRDLLILLERDAEIEPNPLTVGGRLRLDFDETVVDEHVLVSALASSTIRKLVKVDLAKLRRIIPRLEAHVHSGIQMPNIFTALAKIRVFTASNCEQFLRNNQLYDPLAVGKFCETAGLPELACIAYEKGRCYKELVAVTNLYSMFEQQAHCLVEWGPPELWTRAFAPTNPRRRQLIDQVIATALPGCADHDRISVVAEALRSANCPLELSESLEANLPACTDLYVVTIVAKALESSNCLIELIELLEKITLRPSRFSGDDLLQNMMVRAAICADRGKVDLFLVTLKNYDPTMICDFMERHDMDTTFLRSVHPQLNAPN